MRQEEVLLDEEKDLDPALTSFEEDIPEEEIDLIEIEQNGGFYKDLGEGSLTDLVDMYLKEINVYRLLTKDEQLELGKRKDKGDEDAKNTLIKANLKLVVYVAKQYLGHDVDMMDLIQEGNIGLMKAVEKYDYRKGYAFSTYATWWIKQSCGRYVADNSRSVRVPVHTVEEICKLRKAIRNIALENGRNPTIEEITEFLGWTREKVLHCMSASQSVESLDRKIDTLTGDKDSCIGDFIEDDKVETPDKAIDRIAMETVVDELINTLSEKEREVLILRYGLHGEERHTLDEIGKMKGLTRERIRQIEKNAIRKLKLKKRKYPGIEDDFGLTG